MDTLCGMRKAAVSGMDGSGPGKWRREYTEQLRGKMVYILPDHDGPGMEYAEEAAGALSKIAGRVSIVNLLSVWPEMPEHADVTDLIEKFGVYEGWRKVYRATATASPWEPKSPHSSVPASVSADSPPAVPDAVTAMTDKDTWELPIPFEEIETPDFPVECLPGPLSDFVECLSEEKKTGGRPTRKLTVNPLAIKGGSAHTGPL